jgi:protein subunit release factor A
MMEKILLEISAGEGGADSASFVKDLAQVYL